MLQDQTAIKNKSQKSKLVAELNAELVAELVLLRVQLLRCPAEMYPSGHEKHLLSLRPRVSQGWKYAVGQSLNDP